MRSKYTAIVAFVLALMLFSFAAGMIVGLDSQETREQIAEQYIEEQGLLSGSELKTMMNEARLSPGMADAYAEDNPMYAYLFDGTFIEYKED